MNGDRPCRLDRLNTVCMCWNLLRSRWERIASLLSLQAWGQGLQDKKKESRWTVTRLHMYFMQARCGTKISSVHMLPALTFHRAHMSEVRILTTQHDIVSMNHARGFNAATLFLNLRGPEHACFVRACATFPQQWLHDA